MLFEETIQRKSQNQMYRTKIQQEITVGRLTNSNHNRYFKIQK